jgi:NADPH-dependent 2,4-dienoyl-CoA reductase/sulfur reductase-like enzyme
MQRSAFEPAHRVQPTKDRREARADAIGLKEGHRYADGQVRRLRAVTIRRKARSSVSRSRRVIVAGAGVAGLETALALRAYAGELLSVHVIAPEQEFTYRPLAVAEPFLAGEVKRAPLEGLVRAAGADFRSGALVGVDAEHRIALLETGSEAAYDVLVLALGARSARQFPGRSLSAARKAGRT